MVAGHGPLPAFVLSLVRNLPDDSLTVGMAAGHGFAGWGGERFVLAAIYDAVMLNTKYGTPWKGEPPTFPPYPRPGDGDMEPENETKTAKSVNSLYRMFGGANAH